MLKKIFEGIKYKVLSWVYEGDYSDIEYNSTKVEEKGIFVALEGLSRDGHDYIEDAIHKGAKLIIVSKDIDIKNKNINIIKVENTRKILGRLTSNLYNHPEKKLKIIGVTGTNGKTTTSYLIHSFLNKSAFIGSVGVEIGNKKYPPVNTTPESLDIIKYAKEAVEQGLNYLVLEVSSQGIDNWRIEGLEFAGAIFTNLTKEHLDYHKNMEEYYSVKERLFSQLLPCDSIAITNIGDEYGKRIKERYPKAISYGSLQADYKGTILDMGLDKMTIKVEGFGMEYNLETSLIGEYNLLNITAAIAMVEGLREDTSIISDRLKNLCCVEGRMEVIEKNDIKVIVDYAHTEDALEKVLKTLRNCKPRKLLTLVSGTGERYKEKRPILGEIAGRYSDYVFISSNSPRFEDPYSIAEEVAKGMEKIDYSHYEIEVDRKKAVEKIIEMARGGDVVILTGKGHERYQEIRGVKEEYKEIEIVKKVLDKI